MSSLPQKFSLKKHILGLIALILLAWIIGGGSTGYRSVRSISINPDAPVFQPLEAGDTPYSMADGDFQPEERDHDDWRAPWESSMNEDSQEDLDYYASSSSVQKRNQRIADLYDIIRENPCDKRSRREMAGYTTGLAISLLWSFQDSSKEGESRHRANLQANKDAIETLFSAGASGLIIRSDFPFWQRLFISKKFLNTPRCEEEQTERGEE